MSIQYSTGTVSLIALFTYQYCTKKWRPLHAVADELTKRNDLLRAPGLQRAKDPENVEGREPVVCRRRGTTTSNPVTTTQSVVYRGVPGQ